MAKFAASVLQSLRPPLNRCDSGESEAFPNLATTSLRIRNRQAKNKWIKRWTREVSGGDERDLMLRFLCRRRIVKPAAPVPLIYGIIYSLVAAIQVQYPYDSDTIEPMKFFLWLPPFESYPTKVGGNEVYAKEQKLYDARHLHFDLDRLAHYLRATPAKCRLLSRNPVQLAFCAPTLKTSTSNSNACVSSCGASAFQRLQRRKSCARQRRKMLAFSDTIQPVYREFTNRNPSGNASPLLSSSRW